MIRHAMRSSFIQNLFFVTTCTRQISLQSYVPKTVIRSCTSGFLNVVIKSTRPLCLNSFSTTSNGYPKQFSEEELRNRLTPQQYEVTQQSGTERAFTGQYWDNHRKGIYKCVVCKEDLFSSETKFESGSGWPSFYDIITKGKVELVKDNSYGMVRTEVLCSSCGAHLGHVFDDGPKPTGQRYCMNSASLDFVESEE